jgi:hypothetical protein
MFSFSFSMSYSLNGLIVDFSSMSSLSNLGCVDYTLDNLFASFDSLHSCKMLIYIYIFNSTN